MNVRLDVLRGTLPPLLKKHFKPTCDNFVLRRGHDIVDALLCLGGAIRGEECAIALSIFSWSTLQSADLTEIAPMLQGINGLEVLRITSMDIVLDCLQATMCILLSLPQLRKLELYNIIASDMTNDMLCPPATSVLETISWASCQKLHWGLRIDPTRWHIPKSLIFYGLPYNYHVAFQSPTRMAAGEYGPYILPHNVHRVDATCALFLNIPDHHIDALPREFKERVELLKRMTPPELYAHFASHPRALKQLVDKGLPVNGADEYGCTILHRLATTSKYNHKEERDAAMALIEELLSRKRVKNA